MEGLRSRPVNLKALWYGQSLTKSMFNAFRKKAMFVAVVSDTDDESAEHFQVLLKDGIYDKLTSAFFVVKKIVDEVEKEEFLGLFPDTPLPSITFISCQREIMCVLSRDFVEEQVRARIILLLKEHGLLVEQLLLNKYTSSHPRVGFEVPMEQVPSVVEVQTLHAAPTTSWCSVSETGSEYQLHLEKAVEGFPKEEGEKTDVIKPIDLTEPRNDEPQDAMNVPDPPIVPIQLRLPGGLKVVAEFPIFAAFGRIREFVKDDLNVEGEFQLYQVYPPKELVEDKKSLMELGMTVRTTIIVKMAGGTVVARGRSGIFHALGNAWNFLMIPIHALQGYIWHLYRFLAPDQAITEIPHNSRDGNKTVFKREGAINKFVNREDSDSDSDNNTYNGNSTQQQ